MNIIHQNSNDIDNVWKMLNSNLECQNLDSQFVHRDFRSNIDDVAKYFQSDDYEKQNAYDNVPKNILQIGAEMYTYLNF